jgi:hypothetical protein
MGGQRFEYSQQALTPEQLQAFHAAVHSQQVPINARDFMRDHGIGYVFGDFSQAVEEACLQTPTPVVASRATFSGQSFRPFTTNTPPPASHFAFGEFSSSTLSSGTQSQPPLEDPIEQVNNAEHTPQEVNRPQTVAGEQVQAPESAEPRAAGGNRQSKQKVQKTGREGRLYKQGQRWTEHETLVLIEGKASIDAAIKEDGGARAKHTTAIVRWDKVEDHCFANGDERSGSSCKDKWENVLGEVKKVRDYEKRIPSGRDSYWSMDANAKREAALPPNVSKAVFDQIVDALGNNASMNPPSMVESGRKEGSDEELSQADFKGGCTTEQRKRA